MKRNLMIAACLSAWLTVAMAGLVVAQDPQQKPPAAKRNGQMNAKKLQQMDADSDGQVARAEWTGRPKGFDRLDANGDDVLAREEIVSQAQSARFKQMDANSDGKIARAEWKGRPKGFDRLDIDADGFLTLEELRAARGKRGNTTPPTPATPPVKPAF